MKTKFLIPLMAGLALLCACKGKGGASETADTAYVVTRKAISVEPGDTIRSHPKVVKTADMRFQVKSVEQTTEQITALTANFNGTVIHHWMRSTPGDSTDIRKSEDSILRLTVINSTAEMMVKIPPPNVENFMEQVARLGIYVKNSKMDVSDKTLDYLSARLKLKNQRELVKGQKATSDNKTPEDLLAFKNNMVDQQINNRRTDDSVRNSVITLSFYEDNTITRKVIANSNLSAYNLPFSKRMALSFENGWDVFVTILAGIANFWVLLPIGLGIWLVVRYSKTKKISVPEKG